MVPVVPALSEGSQRHERVLGGPAGRVVRVVSVQVRCRVDEPREVEDNDVAKGASDPVAIPEVVAPESTHQAGEDEAHEKGEPRVRLLLENDGPVC